MNLAVHLPRVASYVADDDAGVGRAGVVMVDRDPVEAGG